MQKPKILTPGRYAVVASTLALFFALGGPAAAINTVDTFDIVNDTIQSVDLKNDAISTLDVHDETLTGADIDDGSVRSADIADHSIEYQDFALAAAIPARWTVVEANGHVLSADAVIFQGHPSPGTYQFTTSDPFINSCAWVATAGGRNGTIVDPRSTVTINQLPPSTIVVTTAVNGVVQDVGFNMGLFC